MRSFRLVLLALSVTAVVGAAPERARATATVAEAMAMSAAVQVPLVARLAEPPGAGCAAGGERVSLGNDLDGDGRLSDAETTVSLFVCDDALASPLERATTRASMPAGALGLALALLVLALVVRQRPAPAEARFPARHAHLQ
jgi:hypothetical protein